MSAATLRAHQQAAAIPYLTALHDRCRRRFLQAARLVGADPAQWPHLAGAGVTTSIEMGPLLPFWSVLCDRYRAELFTPQSELFGPREPHERFSQFVHWRLWPLLASENECVRNVLRATGTIPARDRTGPAGALVLYMRELTLAADSRFAIAWFEQFGFAEGEFGVADVLARAKVTSVAGLAEAGLLASRAGKVRLLAPAELPEGWDPIADPRLTVWEMVHHLIRVLESGGEAAAGELAAKLGARAEIARELAYRLYSTAERKKRAAEALQYNGLVQSWPEIMRLARDRETAGGATAQADMFSRA